MILPIHSDSMTTRCIAILMVAMPLLQVHSFSLPSTIAMPFLARNKYIERCTITKSKFSTSRCLEMKLYPVTRDQSKILISSSVTPAQWKSYWGNSPLERIQRILESVLFAYGGAWLAWFFSFMAGNFVSAIAGAMIIFNWVLNPFLSARRLTYRLRYADGDGKRLHHALFKGRLAKVRKLRRRSGKSIGQVAQEFLDVLVIDEEGREIEIVTPWRDEYRPLRRGMMLETLIASRSKFYEDVYNVADAYIPVCNVWVGDFPYLNRRYFRRLCDDVFPKDNNSDYNSSTRSDSSSFDGDHDDGDDDYASPSSQMRKAEILYERPL